ncbi:MAG: triose-phosphate isomerase [Spirochaetales bacterium]|nr:triose-phosphate isomerase [Spirochaetales bacterium]
MRRKFMAGNWKMHKTIAEATAYARELVDRLGGESARIMIAPPFTALAAVGATVKGSNIQLGAQNCAPELSGAHTGEVSLSMLKECGVNVVILGHSERRHVYLETDELVNRKVKLALSEGCDVILCVGETESERDKGVTEKVVKQQVKEGLQGVSAEELKRVVIAYEPVWAIGTGKNATPQDANAVHVFIRRLIAEIYDPGVAERLVIQYGGSVKPGNVKELMAEENIDGALVGGASLSAEQFVPIVQAGRS